VRDKLELDRVKHERKIPDNPRRRVYKKGELVWLSTENLSSYHFPIEDYPRKLNGLYIGPFQVAKVHSAVVYELTMPRAAHFIRKFHISKLKRWHTHPNSKYKTRDGAFRRI
jgi:hypothetical protein